MSQHRPSTGNLLATIQESLDEAATQVPAELRFKMKVASYLVGICERELAGAGPDADAASWARLLGQEGGTPAVLTRYICSVIRAGKLDAVFNETVETVLLRTTADVQVVRPGHLPRDHQQSAL